MAALSPAHFLLWARLTTASPTPSVTPSEGTIRQTSVGVSSSTCPRHKFYQCAPPPAHLFLDHKWANVSMCVCLCACVIPLCLTSRSAGWLSVSITSSVFATLSHTAAPSVWLHCFSLHPTLPPPPPPRCLDEGHELRESRDQHNEYRW